MLLDSEEDLMAVHLVAHLSLVVVERNPELVSELHNVLLRVDRLACPPLKHVCDLGYGGHARSQVADVFLQGVYLPLEGADVLRHLGLRVVHGVRKLIYNLDFVQDLSILGVQGLPILVELGLGDPHFRRGQRILLTRCPQSLPPSAILISRFTFRSSTYRIAGGLHSCTTLLVIYIFNNFNIFRFHFRLTVIFHPRVCEIKPELLPIFSNFFLNDFPDTLCEISQQSLNVR